MNKIKRSVVFIGGGGGVYQIVRYYKNIVLSEEEIVTISSMFDRGGHSEILRNERHILPPGDIMQAIFALSGNDIDPKLKGMLSHRFSKKGKSSLNDATMRNFLFTYFVEINDGDVLSAINDLCKFFHVRGKVLPISTNDSDLCVRLSDGSILKDEGKIDKRSIRDDRTISSAFLSPKAHICPEAREAIANAGKIVFCPGDLFTSIIPNTLVEGFKEALLESKAKTIFFVNLMTKKAETNNFPASKFVSTLLEYLGRDKFDLVICNNGKISKKIRDAYQKEFSYPVKIDKELHKLAHRVIVEDLVSEVGGVLRHKERASSIVLEA